MNLAPPMKRSNPETEPLPGLFHPMHRSTTPAKGDKGRAQYERSLQYLPAGSGTLSKIGKLIPEEPCLVDRADGCRMWDVDGNVYIDYRCALGPVVLGHRHPEVVQAVTRQLQSGIVFSYPHPLEGMLAEELVSLLPAAEMVRFLKTGSEANAAAFKLARAYTGRDLIISSGYHGWMQAVNNTLGIPRAVADGYLSFAYGDLNALEQLLQQHEGKVAAVTLSGSYPHLREGDEFPAKLRQLTQRHGVLLIIDEIVTGFRVRIGGYHEYYELMPDLATFAKGMANGMPLSAVTGRREIMKLSAREAAISSTFSGETLSLAASLAVIEVFRREPVIEHLWSMGERLISGLNEVFATNALPISLQGLPPCPRFVFASGNPMRDAALQAAFFRGMFRAGIMLYHVPYVTYSHGRKEIDQTINAARGLCENLDESLESVVDEDAPVLGAAAMR